MANQLGFVVEQNYCMGCKTCQVACKDKHDLEVGQLFRRVTETEGGGYAQTGAGITPNIFAFWTSLSCNHCEHPKCVENCPTGAMHKRSEDGVVVVDQQKCVGCGYCTWSCPYGAPQYNPALGKMGKCDFCLDYLAQGQDPACVAACPVRALHYGELAEIKQKYSGVPTGKGLPAPNITSPSLIIVRHKDAID